MWAIIFAIAVIAADLAPLISRLGVSASSVEAKKYCDSLLGRRPFKTAKDGVALNLDAKNDSDPVAMKGDSLQSLYFCHPMNSSSYVRCVVGVAAVTKRVIVVSGEAVPCKRGTFFNSVIKACVFARHSNCAARFGGSSSSSANDRERNICNSYLKTTTSWSAFSGSFESHLVCDGESKTDFVVCALNAGAAHRFTCADGMVFNQTKGKCVADAAGSDCIIDAEGESHLEVGSMAVVLPVHRCVCGEAILGKSKREVIHVADPIQSNRFLLCAHGGAIHILVCPESLHWNEFQDGCAKKAYRKRVLRCDGGSGPSPAGHGSHASEPRFGPDGHGSDSSDRGTTAAGAASASGRGPAGYESGFSKPTKVGGSILTKHRCICAVALRAAGKGETAYRCDPEDHAKFLVCRDGRISRLSCPPGLFWTSKLQACSPHRQCLAVPVLCTSARTRGWNSKAGSRNLDVPYDFGTGFKNKDYVNSNADSKFNDVNSTFNDDRSLPFFKSIAERRPSAIQRCVCSEALTRSGRGSVLQCDPLSQDGFLVCHAAGTHLQRCSFGLRWNVILQSCSTVWKCLPVPSKCRSADAGGPFSPLPMPRPVPVPRPVPRPVPVPWPWPVPTTTTTTTSTTTTTTTAATTTANPCVMRYILHQKKLDWSTARLVCEANLMELAVILNNETQAYLEKVYGSDKKKSYGGIWIGASDGGDEGTWRWVTGPVVNYSNWFPGQPSGYKYQHCMQFNYYRVRGAWDDTRCYYKKKFLCQKEDCSPIVPLPSV